MLYAKRDACASIVMNNVIKNVDKIKIKYMECNIFFETNIQFITWMHLIYIIVL